MREIILRNCMKNELKLLLATNYLNQLAFGLFGPLYALFVLDLGGTAVDAGLTWGFQYLAAGILIIAFGKMEDANFNKRKMVVVGYFTLATAFAALYFIENISSLYLVQLVHAAGIGMLFPAWKAAYTLLEDRGREASEWSWFDGGNFIAYAVASLAAGYILSSTGFKGLFLLMAGIQLLGALISLKLLRFKDGEKNVGGKTRKTRRKRR